MSDGDPFEELDEEVEDREGDPFDRLGDPAAGDDGQSPSESGADEFFPDPPGEETDAGDSATRSDRDGMDRGDPIDPDAPAGGPDTSAEQSETGPAFDLGDDGLQEPTFDSAGRREGDPFEQVDDAFTEMDVDDVDPNDVWEELGGSGSRDATSQTGERTYAEVSKHSYCEQCKFFSDPPDVSCAHEGTEIVEFLDMDSVRVVDCPIVAERKEIREGNAGPE